MKDAISENQRLVSLQPGERVYPWWYGFVELGAITLAMLAGFALGRWSCHIL